VQQTQLQGTGTSTAKCWERSTSTSFLQIARKQSVIAALSAAVGSELYRVLQLENARTKERKGHFEQRLKFVIHISNSTIACISIIMTTIFKTMF
jgi:hypothetical protein